MGEDMIGTFPIPRADVTAHLACSTRVVAGARETNLTRTRNDSRVPR